jgi:hypothetical protein
MDWFHQNSWMRSLPKNDQEEGIRIMMVKERKWTTYGDNFYKQGLVHHQL